LSSNECTLPFIVQGMCLHCAGPQQVDPANRSLFYERYGDLHLQLLSVVFSIEKLMCISTARIWPCAVLSCIVTAISVTQQWSCVTTVGWEPVSRRSSADPLRRCLRVHCGSARLGSPITGHHHAVRGAVMGLYAACAQYMVTRRAALETGGFTLVSAYLPRVSVVGHAF
jgi:hypothetical protein